MIWLGTYRGIQFLRSLFHLGGSRLQRDISVGKEVFAQRSLCQPSRIRTLQLETVTKLSGVIDSKQNKKKATDFVKKNWKGERFGKQRWKWEEHNYLKGPQLRDFEDCIWMTLNIAYAIYLHHSLYSRNGEEMNEKYPSIFVQIIVYQKMIFTNYGSRQFLLFTISSILCTLHNINETCIGKNG